MSMRRMRSLSLCALMLALGCKPQTDTTAPEAPGTQHDGQGMTLEWLAASAVQLAVAVVAVVV